MVDVTEFFKSNKKLSPKQSVNIKKPTGNVKVPVSLDSDEDDLKEVLTIQKKKGSHGLDTSSKRTHSDDDCEHPDVNVTTRKKSTIKTPGIVDTSEIISAYDVLKMIPSLDLDNIHIKKNISFDFRNKNDDKNTDTSCEVPYDYPQGKPNCLMGLTIVFTGILPGLERGAAENLAKRYGAKVTKAVSGKTSVVVLGDEAGPSKVEKIKKLGIKVIDEDGFKQLIGGMPANGGSGEAAEKARQKVLEQQQQALRDAEDMDRREREMQEKCNKAVNFESPMKSLCPIREQDKLWTVKYAPVSLQQICGNKSSVTKLKNWLSNWNTFKKQNFKNPGKDGTGIFRSAMIYGPPGIGKTTAAHLVAKELGYDILEKNASDVRSKTLLNNDIKNVLDNTSIVGFFKHKYDHNNNNNNNKFVIIMDEVDGMSGGDRGGVGQMAQFCRKTSTPMILICNERNLPKMRPFDRVCLDIQFRRPDAQSIKARLMTIAVRESFKLDPNMIDQLVSATGGDIRQIINLLYTVTKSTDSIDHKNITTTALSGEKNIALKPFDITHKLFSGHIYTDIGSQSFPLYKKVELYFDDFDFVPLMIQENYLNTNPSNLKPGKSHLEVAAEAANDISLSDIVEKKIRSSEQLWSLLPLHAIMSSIKPAALVAGSLAGRINFTSWLGQNSKAGKYYRLLQELHYHTRLSTSTDKFGFRMNYIPTLKKRLLDPLVTEGSDATINIIRLMDEYYLSKEDWDSIMEFLIGNDKTDLILKKIPTTVKSGFTRKYNSMTHPVSIYKTGTAIPVNSGKSSRDKPDFEDVVDADDDVPPNEEEDIDDDTDFKKDKLIKQGRSKSVRKASSASKKGPAKKRKTT